MFMRGAAWGGGRTEPGNIATKGQRARLSECSDSARIVKDKDEISQFEANLTTKACTRGRNSTRGTPATVGKPGDDETTTEPSGAEEAGLENSNDGEAFRVGEN
ncbi:hypothetical protein HG531_010134 [Fusarium graminearum]|nr:hypothetical protein HG531_010134 [Fusarium graminearum]